MNLIRHALILLLVLIVGAIHPFNQIVLAQSGQRLEVVSVNTEGFPVVRVQFEAYNAGGDFATDLRVGDVLIRENDQNISVTDLELLRPGVQFIVALNLGSDLSNRYAGLSRFEAIRQSLETWIETQVDDSSDQFSLATNTGLQLIHSRDVGEWTQVAQGLESVDLLQERPSLVALSRAVDLATDPNPDNVMKRAILFITPMIPAANLEALPNLADRAAEQGVPVHVWLVASPAARTNNPQFFDMIEQMTGSTGGELFIFSGPEDLPDLDNVLNPSRYVYRAQYASQIKNSATHVIGIEVRRGNFQQRSADKPVYLDVLPPIPIFLSPQSVVERQWVSGDNPRAAALEPESLQMRIVVEYPDGKPREIKASRLYVNDVLVDQNLVEPFDILEWPLGALQEGRFILRAEVEDSLGLRQSSIDVPVTLSVEVIETGWWQTAMAGDRPLVIGAIAAAGLLLLFSLTVAGRGVVRAAILRRKRALDPLTQPLPAPKERSGKLRPKFHVERSTWPRQAMAGLSAAPAWLVRLPENGNNPMNNGVEGERPVNPSNAIPLTRREITLGSDVLRAQYCVDSTTVSGLHARILQTPEGGCQIFDADSVAGTWVNFVQVPEGGVLLHHGDLIHLGRVAFRFELANPPEQSQPKVRSFQDIV
jgi:hypothetical protein